MTKAQRTLINKYLMESLADGDSMTANELLDDIKLQSEMSPHLSVVRAQLRQLARLRLITHNIHEGLYQKVQK